MIRGNGPSPSEAGGNAAFTSIGVPSQLGVVLRTVSLALEPVPHSRTWSVGLAVQVRSPPKTLLIAACALGASSNDPAITETSSSSFRIRPSVRSLDPGSLRRCDAPLQARGGELTFEAGSPLVGLAGRQVLGDPLGATAALNARRELRMAVAELAEKPLPQRSDRDLGAVLPDRPRDCIGDLLRRGCAQPRRRLGPRVGEHPGLADKAGRDDRATHAVGMQVLPQAEDEPTEAELGRVVEGGPRRSDLSRQRSDEDEVAVSLFRQLRP